MAKRPRTVLFGCPLDAPGGENEAIRPHVTDNRPSDYKQYISDTPRNPSYWQQRLFYLPILSFKSFVFLGLNLNTFSSLCCFRRCCI